MLKIGDKTFTSRLLVGTARYPSPEKLRASIAASGAQIVTVSLRRESRGGGHFRDLVSATRAAVLPTTAGFRTAAEAITIARMARELFDTSWIKLEVIGDEDTLQPDPFELVDAAAALCAEGFEVFPYTTEDAIVAERLLSVGCRILMPWGSPIGSGRGLAHREALASLRARFPEATLIVDAGIGRPSHAAEAMELGYDAVLLNTAIAIADDPPAMARAFALAVEAGRTAFEAGPMKARDMAVPSTPALGRPWETK